MAGLRLDGKSPATHHKETDLIRGQTTRDFRGQSNTGMDPSQSTAGSTRHTHSNNAAYSQFIHAPSLIYTTALENDSVVK